MDEIFSNVYTELGPCHTESVYHRALEVELRCANIPYDTEVIVPVRYKNHTVGNVRCDLIIDGEIIVELKSVTKLTEDHRQQLRNYLKILNKPMGILVNFGPASLSIEEILHPNE